jgi:predicted metal-dependent hydrolase
MEESNGLVWAFIFFILLVGYSAMYFKQSKYPMAYIKSTVDGERYYVRNMADSQDAADRLARVRAKLKRLRDHIAEKYPNIVFVKQIVANFDARPDQFSESTPEAVHTSYTVDKEKVFMCLRQRNSQEELVSENIVVFVALHEMSHVGTASIGHTPEFWNNFSWLLKQAEEIDIYKYTDFSAHPVEYCGVHITDSPTYKAGVEDGIRTESSTDSSTVNTEPK